MTKIKILIFVFANVYFMIHMSYVSDAALSPICPNRTGIFQNRFNCSQYIYCLNYTVIGVGVCPRNLYFSKVRMACVPNYMSNCTRLNRRFARDVSSEKNPEFDCTGKSDGFYSDLTKCGSYYECRNEIASSGDCVGNYEWNSEKNQCDVPQNSDCTKKKHLPNSTSIPPSNLTDHSQETTTIKGNETKDIQTTTSSSLLTTIDGEKEDVSTDSFSEKDQTTNPSTKKEVELTTTDSSKGSTVSDQIDQKTLSPDQKNTTTQKDKDQTSFQTTEKELKTTTESSYVDKTSTDYKKDQTDSGDINPTTTEKPSITTKKSDIINPTTNKAEITGSTTTNESLTTKNERTTTQISDSSTTEQSGETTDQPFITTTMQQFTTGQSLSTTERLTTSINQQSTTTEESERTEQPTTEQQSTLDPICKKETDVKLVDPNSCNHYYQCDKNGLSVRKKCEPSFLRFHRYWKACVPSFLVDCKIEENHKKEKKVKEREKEREEEREEREKEREEKEKEIEEREKEREEREKEREEREKEGQKRYKDYWNERQKRMRDHFKNKDYYKNNYERDN